MNLTNSSNETDVHFVPIQCPDLAFCKRYVGTGAFNELTIFHITAILFIAIFTFLINGFFILMIYLFEELRHTSNYFFLNIALVNMTFGFSSLVTCAALYKKFLDCTVDVCFYKDVYVYISGTAFVLTMTTFTVISIERYICIVYALRWVAIITTRRVMVVLGSVWLLWIAITTFCRATNTWKSFRTLFMIQSVFDITVIFITNVIIFKEIRRHEKMIAEQETADNIDEIRKAREKKRAKTFIFMATLVILCYLPSLVLLIGYRIPTIDEVNWQYAWFFSRTIFLSHTAFDIIVYGLRSEETRNGFKKIVRRFCCVK